MRWAPLGALVAVALLTASACTQQDEISVRCNVFSDSCDCSVISGKGNLGNIAACGDNLTPAALCCASPGWPNDPGSPGCSCVSSPQPGQGTCGAPMLKVTRCTPTGEPIAEPDSAAPPVCQQNAGASLPGSQVCCGRAQCDLATQTCCITDTPPQSLLCTAKGAACAGKARECNGASDCGGNACCEDSLGAGAACASGGQCSAGQRTICKTAADCPAAAPMCCGIDLILIPMGHFIYSACRASC